MEFKLTDWIVNEGNIFELNELEFISIRAIESEIFSQIKLHNVTTDKEFLIINLDLSNRIFGTNDLSIEKILTEYLIIEIGSPEHYNMVCMVLDYLSFWLQRKYRTNESSTMYSMSHYKEHYESLRKEYCEQLLDADETDFINAQLALCNALEKELQKPVYTEFDILGITENPNKFKQELTLTIVKRRAYLNEKLNSLSTSIDAPQFDTKNLSPPTKAIRFSEQLVKEKFLKALSGCFDDSDTAALEIAFDGNILTEPLLFPHNQNKLVEVFRRAKYNGLIVSTSGEIKNWLCSNFTFRFTKGTATAVKELNPSTVHDILTKGRGEPTKGERICVTDWLPYKSPILLKQASQNEKL